MSTSNNNEIAPDMPVMRSVLIRSAAPAVPAPRGLHFMQKSAPVFLSKPSTWKPASVPQLPEMYPLERSHVLIQDADTIEIATRIADCLRQESIAATFVENKAVAETTCHTQFYVKLFEDDNQVIVEVQRRSGCSYTFSQCSKAILRAAKGQDSQKAPQYSVPAAIRRPEEEFKVNAECLEQSFDLLQQERIDAQLLGMQLLLKLSEKVRLGDRLELVINHVKVRPADDDHFAAVLRRDALTVLANSLVENQPTELLSDDLLRILIADLTDHDLHTAHQAARCLTAICQCRKLKQLVTKMGVSSATFIARQEGQSRHKLLERETRQLQMELEG